MKEPPRLDFPDGVIDSLLARPSRAAQRAYLAKFLAGLDSARADDLAEALKQRVFQNIFTDIQAALNISGLILYLSKRTGNDLHRALGLRAKGHALNLGLSEYQKALRLYGQALAIHKKHGDRLGQAAIISTSILAMASVGKRRQALEAGRWAGEVLKEHAQWLNYASLQNNLSIIYNRHWNFAQALECIEEARRGYLALGDAGLQYLPNAEVNRTFALCSLGRFTESLQANQTALDLALALDQKIVYAKAQHNRAITYFVMGRYNEALDLLLKAREGHCASGQLNDAAMCDLSITDCLLELNRPEAVLEYCAKAIPIFEKLDMRLEAAEAVHNQALAYLRLNRISEATTALQTVRQIFAEEHLPHGVTIDLEIAHAYLRAGEPARALQIVQKCIEELEALGPSYEAVQARLVAARALYQLSDREQSQLLLEAGMQAAVSGNWPGLIFQAYHLLGRSLLDAGQRETALKQYTLAVGALERLRSQVMLEFRPGFLEGRETVYAETVSLCLELADPRRGLEFAERARSHALLEVWSGRVDLALRARQPADEPMVQEIQRMQNERQIYVRQIDYLSLDVAPRVNEEVMQLQDKVLALEKEITDLRQKLLIRNAAYQQDAVLWETNPELPRIPLDQDTLLLEFFTLEDHLVLFLITSGGATGAEHIAAVRLPVTVGQVEGLLQGLQVNFSAVPSSDARTRSFLVANVQRILQRLYGLLLAPVAGEIAHYRHFIIVPHGGLHYLPFHALHDGQHYLVETHDIRYIPTVRLLDPVQKEPAARVGILVMGHSFQGRLPSTLEEAGEVAALWGTEPLLEQDATLERLRAEGPQYPMIHLACHGDFRPDNPLFSGLALQDGWLTTLEIFNWRLSASLVTLSACQTGRGVVGGGDDLAGLMRAFLSAGARTLVLSQWAVADQATALLMRNFYCALASGEEKPSALRQAMLDLLHGDPLYQHPYFWAPFFLVGDGGRL